MQSLPHLLGFVPTDSLVVVPLAHRGPVAPMDLPVTPGNCAEASESPIGGVARDDDEQGLGSGSS